MDTKVRVLLQLRWLMFLFLALSHDGNASKLRIARRSLLLKQHLKRLNKPSVKSIKSPDCDIIDCVHISHQPAFDHPHFQNHTVQMRPSYQPEGVLTENEKVAKSEKITQMWHMNPGNNKCPQGTIPIRRTKEEDLLRANSVKRYGMKKHKTIPRPLSKDEADDPELDVISQHGHQHAVAYVEGGKYYGAKAAINVWDPKIQQTNEFSVSQLWILGGSFTSVLNSIEAGWQVSPELYGDNNTRLFTYWTTDSYKATGCYNLLCSGFVQVNNEIALGASISPVSEYQSSQYDISILIWKDPKQGNWWMQFGNEHVIGYWPASLFSYLSDSASTIEWGGEVVNSQSDGGQHTTTQMGSGHFPREGFRKASYFRNIQIVDDSNKLRPPEDIGRFAEDSSCYDVDLGNNGDWGDYFYFGGPGRNPNCP